MKNLMSIAMRKSNMKNLTPAAVIKLTIIQAENILSDKYPKEYRGINPEDLRAFTSIPCYGCEYIRQQVHSDICKTPECPTFALASRIPTFACNIDTRNLSLVQEALYVGEIILEEIQ